MLLPAYTLLGGFVNIVNIVDLPMKELIAYLMHKGSSSCFSLIFLTFKYLLGNSRKNLGCKYLLSMHSISVGR
jgi:hypothetical protein